MLIGKKTIRKHAVDAPAARITASVTGDLKPFLFATRMADAAHTVIMEPEHAFFARRTKIVPAIR